MNEPLPWYAPRRPYDPDISYGAPTSDPRTEKIVLRVSSKTLARLYEVGEHRELTIEIVAETVLEELARQEGQHGNGILEVLRAARNRRRSERVAAASPHHSTTGRER